MKNFDNLKTANGQRATNQNVAYWMNKYGPL